MQYEKRSFDVDVLACPRCGDRLRLIATIDDPRVIREIRAALALPVAGTGRAPPDGALFSADSTADMPA
ncbi:MAG: hypothetical protein HY728_01455 [Candidatus Rokubacteria bacterium]|nr:hypothetical protein [Candidatus Rokubacteria bacterium]